MPPEYFQWLGIESPPEEGKYFVTWQNYVKTHPKPDEDDELDALPDLTREEPLPWTAEERPRLANWLKENEVPLALTIAASRRPQYYNPLVPKRIENHSVGFLSALQPTVQECRALANALACRAMLRTGEGNPDAAWEDLLACHRLARLLGRGATMIELLAGAGIEYMVNRADIVFLEHAKLTSNQLEEYLADLQRLPSIPTIANQLDLGERFLVTETVVLMARHGPEYVGDLSEGKSDAPPADEWSARLFTHSINWDPALKNANRWIDRLVASLRRTDRSARSVEVTAIVLDLRALMRQVGETGVIKKGIMGPASRGEFIGNMAFLLLLPTDKVQDSADQWDQEQRNLQVAFALAAYYRDRASYPAKLDEVAPKYLAKIPDDIFSGEPLIYQLADGGYLLYSVGPNGVDEDGRGYQDLPWGDDVSVRMPAPGAQDKD